MKSFFEKHDLFKIVGIAILLIVFLTWLIPVGSFSSGEMVVSEITRVGLNDLFTNGLLSIYYFAIIITFLLILGGFYQVLSKTTGYQSLIDRLTKFLKGKEIGFVLIVSFIFGALASISNEIFQLLIFVPFIITLILRLKMDKITALCTTFGSILIGVLGATFSPMILESLNGYLTLTYTSDIITKVLLFLVTYSLFNFFNYIHIRKTLKNTKNQVDEVKEDKFALPEKTEKSNIWPLVIVLGFLALYVIIGYITWKDSFNITIFNKFNTWLVGLSVKDVPVVSYVLGTSYAFGTWDLYTIQMIMLIATGVIALAYNIKLDEFIKSFGEGAKKMLKPLIIVLMIYIVCIFAVVYPVVPTVASFLMKAASGFAKFGSAIVTSLLTSLSVIIASVFNVELRYVASSLAPYFAATFGSTAANPIISIIFQSFYGLVQFIAPTSLMLMLGLAYLEIPYKEWFKYIWKFVVILFGVLLLIIIALCLIAVL